MRNDWPLPRIAVFGCILSLLPVSSAAEAIELSQNQLYQLVSRDAVLGAEEIMRTVYQEHDGTILEMRGFVKDEQIAYRLLLQKSDGRLATIFVDGINGAVMPQTAHVVLSVQEAIMNSSARPRQK